MIEVQEKNTTLYITLDRPEIGNAFNAELIQLLTDAFLSIQDLADIRAVVLKGNGKNFCAGADLNWMQECIQYSEEDNAQDAVKLLQMLESIYNCPVPVIAAVQGGCFGGGVGLAACADIVVAADNAKFCLSEVKVGVVPATISPYVIQAIGARQARRFFTTAEVISANKALAIGLAHEVFSDDELETQVDKIATSIANNGPSAVATAKQLVQIANTLSPTDEDLGTMTASMIAALRVSTEGQEGLKAFLEKRKPTWQK